jgi:hypothetical protein
MLSGWLPVIALASVTLAVKLNTPTAVGVPDILQDPLRLVPVGKMPADTEQTRGAVPPDVAKVWLYDVPTVPLGRELVVIEGVAFTTTEPNTCVVQPSPTEAVE